MPANQVIDSSAGRDIIIAGGDVVTYVVDRVEHYRESVHGVVRSVDMTFSGVERVDNMKKRLLEKPLDKPTFVRVRGTLYPCALLSPGWWDRGVKLQAPKSWNDGLQQWLFYGFHEWGPSWDFTWDLDDPAHDDSKRYFIAQLGDGDESDSISVVMQGERARRLRGELLRGWGGLEAKISGLLVHRTHFADDAALVRLFGNILDYWLWLDDDKPEHVIEPFSEWTSVYSGYLWRCVTTRALFQRGNLGLQDVYFIWEHTNFANDDSIKYNLDSLAHKEDYIRRLRGDDLVLLQKSSYKVPGTPEWSAGEFYNLVLGTTGRRI